VVVWPKKADFIWTDHDIHNLEGYLNLNIADITTNIADITLCGFSPLWFAIWEV